MQVDTERARRALHAIDPGCPREEWVRLAMAAKASGLPFEEFDAWSSTAPNYSERDARSVWQSIKRDDGIGPGTLFRAAERSGWSSMRRGGTQADIAPRRGPQEAPSCVEKRLWPGTYGNAASQQLASIHTFWRSRDCRTGCALFPPMTL